MESQSTIDFIAKSLEQHQFRFSNEAELQLGVQQVLSSLNLSAVREWVLAPRSRIDFLLPQEKIGIEIKVDMSLEGVTRQLWRYADSPAIESLILVTTRHIHQQLPLEMKGKPLRVVYLLNL